MGSEPMSSGTAGSKARRGMARVAAVVLLAGLTVGGLVAAPRPAQAATVNFLVNSLSHQGDDALVGDRVCATAAGVCTLRAALQESNALPTADEAIIAPAEDVDADTPGIQSTGTIVGSGTGTANWMFVGVLTPLGDNGALFYATRSVTLDFQNRLGIRSLSDVDGVTALFIDGPNVAVRNFPNITSNETAFVVGANGDRAIIENGVSIDPASIVAERFLWLASGADGVTVRNVELGSFTGSTSAVRFAANATINDFTLDRVRMYDPDNETYNGVGAHGSAATLNRLRITGSTFEGFNGYPLLLTNITLSDSLISGNTFTRTDNNDMVLRLTRAGFGPVNVIANNTFDNAGSNARNAIWASLGLSVGTDQSGFRIEDNYINGFTERGIFLGFGGTLTVQRNRFGPQSFGDADVAAESGFTVLFLNNGTASNSAIRTWYPTEVTYDTNTCQLAVAVAPPTAGTPPQTPVTIDVYYTATTKAEVYLGRATGITAATTITVPYSLGAGNIRVQTQGANAQSSHYSRTVPQVATDRCSPRATLEQTQSQADPTSVRDLLFTVEFSEVITENLVTGDFTATGSTAQGVTVTDVTRVSPNSFSVRARANSSGTVVLSLVAGAVLDPDGNASQASVSTDNSVTYVSPLTLAPTELTVTEGQPAQTYTVTSSLSATDPITVTPTVVDPRWATVTPNPLEIDTTQTAGDLSVEAVDDALISPTHVTQITHTVSSADPNFDGLLLPDVTVTVLDNDQPVAATSELTVTAGEVVANGTATHTATVTVRNATGGPVAAVLVTFQAESGAHLVIPSCTSGGDGTCTVDITSVLAGSYEIRAFIGGAETGGSPATAVFVPGPAAATTSVITATPATITADGVATSTITVQLRDAQGNNLTTGGATVTIGTDNGAISGVTDNGNGTYTATLTGPTTVGTATLTFTLDGAPGTDTATVAFVPGPADPGTSTIAADPTTIVADGTSTSTVTVQLKDAQGNNLTSGGATVVIATDYGTVSGVTDNGDGSYAATLTSVTVAGTATLSFTVNGAAASATATVSFVAGVADPTTSVITADPVSITADGVSTSTVTVQLRGPLGNNVTFGGADVTIGTDRGTVSAVTDNLNGTYTATLTAATTAGVATLTFTLAGTPGTDTATVAFVPGPMDLGTSTITAAPAAISADGIATSTVTVQLKDAQGNNLTSGGATVVVGTDLGVISGVTDNGNGSYTATLTSVTTAGTATLSFTVDGAAGTDTATVAFVTGTPDATTSVITADPSVIIADGTSTSTITVRLRDTQGNDLTAGGAHVTIATDYGTISGVTDNGNGTYTATLTSVTVAGTATLSFTLEGATAPATATVSFVAGTANPTTSLISADPTTITADGTSTSTVTVQLRGPLGNNVTFGGHNVTIGTDLGTVSGVTDNNNGTYTATLTSATAAGTATVTFTLEGATGTGTATVAFVPGPADPGTSTITAAPAAISADGIATSTVTVQLKDAQGNNLTSGGATVVVGTDLGAISGVTDNGNGSYTATLTSVTTAGTATLSFTIDGAAGTDTATVQFVLGTPDATTSTITADPTTILADGTSTSTVTVQLKDNLGNNLTAGGAQVTIATDYGTISGVTDNGNGSYTATLTSVTVAGTATLSFTVNGIAAPATAAVVFVAGTANPTTSLISADPTTITADGVSTSTVTVQLRGPLGNNVTFGGHNVTIGTDLGTVSAVTDNNNGTYTATLTSATTAGTATVTFTLEGATGTDTATVAFVPGPAAAATSVITADPTTIIADGTSTSTVTVQLKDAQGNNITSGGATVVIATDYGTVSGVTDNNNGTYTATLTSVTTAGTATLTFTLDGTAGTDTATVAFVAGTANPTTSVITADPVSITADGTSTATVTVQLRGPLGNNITTGGHNVGIGTNLGTVSGVTDNNNGTYTATLTSATTAGTATVTFTLEGTLGTDTATVEFVPGPAVAATSVITADPTAITANGIATSTITVRLRDAQGNNLTTGGATVVIATTAGILLDQVVDNGDGSYTESLTSTTTVGIAEVSFTVNGSPGGDTATVEFVAGPAVAGTSEISAAPTSITADGAATATVTVRLRDANGNNLTTGGATVAISTDLGSLSTVTDNADGTYTATLTAPTAVGTATLTFTVAGVAGTRTATVGFVAGPADPARSEITAAPTAITADSESTSTITVRLRDAQGNDLTTGGATVVVAADLGAVSTVTDNNDGTYTATLTSGTTAGLATLSFTVGGSLGTDTATVDFVAGAPDATTSVITAVPVSITADEVATSTVTVQLRDAQGNNLSAGGAHVLLATDLGTVSAVTDNGDGTYTATLTSGTTAGPATLSFTVNGDPAPATATVAFVAGPADVATSTITAVPTPITADGTSTSTVTVQLKDAKGNNLTGGGATVAITSDFGTTSGATDNGDGTYTATLTSATAIGIATVSFTIDDLAGVHTATVEFVAGPPDPGTSVVTANPTSITAGGTATSTATVQLRDANGNDVTTGTAAVVITTDLGTVSPTTRNGDGTYTATLTAAPTAGPATLSFTVDGASGADTATVQVLPGTAAATTSVITADPTSIPADGASTSTATVQLKDANGNNLTTGGATVVIGTDLGTVSGVTDNDNGTYTATFTSATTPGTATLTFTVDGTAATATATVTLTGPADPGTSTITAAPTSITADGAATSAVTVQLKDASGNNLTTGGATVVITTDLGTISGVTDNDNGTYTATLTSATSVGTATLGFTVAGTAGTATATVAFVPGPADPGTSTIAADPGSIVADGVTTSTVTVRLKDAQGNNLTTGGATVVISTDLGTLSATTDNGDGTYTATLTSGTAGGTATLGFSVNAVQGVDTATVAFVPGPSAITSTITADPSSITADGASTSTITVQSKDAEGNDLTIGGATVVISTDLGTVSGVTDNDNGTYTATLTSGTTAGTATLGFTIGGTQAVATVAVALTAGPADPGSSTISAAPGSIVADGVATSTVTVQLRDALGNPLTSSGGTVVISTDAGTISVTTDNGDGTYTASLTSVTLGTATLSYTLGGTPGAATATVAFVVGPPDATTSEITASTTTITADGTSTTTITVRAKDSQGNDVGTGGAAVALATTAGTLSAVTDNGDGTYTATLTAPTTAGSATVSFTLNGTPGANSVVITLEPGVASPATSRITADPTGIAADGNATSTVTVRLIDAYGNQIPTGGPAVVIATDLGTIGATTDNGDGTYTATLTSATTAGTATLSFTIAAVAATATATVEFQPGAAVASTSEVTASPAFIAADGTSTSAITVQAKDAFGNDVTTGGAVVVIATDAGTISGVTDNGNGTYTATLTSATTLGTATLTFTMNGAAGTDTATVRFVPGLADPALSEITADPPDAEADGVTIATILVRLRDSRGFQLEGGGATVTITTTEGTLSAVTGNGDGTYRATLTAPRAPGIATIGFTVNGSTGHRTATVTFTDTVAPAPPVITSPAANAFVRPNTQLAGTGEPGVTITVRDGTGNDVCATVVTEAGDWSCFPGSPLPAGEVDLVAVATDLGANVSPPSTAITVTVVDTTPAVVLSLTDAAPGDTQTALGTGFLPGETISGLLESTPVALGTQSAGGDGRVTFSITIPTDITVGTHRVTLTGQASGAVWATFDVVLVATPDSPELAATGSGEGDLAFTGTNLGALLLLAIVAFALGARLVLAARVRRRRTGP